jgi:C-terminal processing protease CtpA/Prc
MKKIIVLLLLGSSLLTQAQSTQNLFLLGKVWGLIKYFHPALTDGKIDWDAELIHTLPLCEKANTTGELSDSLLAWIDRLPPIPECPACSDSLLQGARLTPDFSWIDKNNLSLPLRSRLKFMIRNRNISGQYYIKFMSDEGISIPLYRNEKAYAKITYPDDTYGLLCLFRFWNAIEYWYPYKYNLSIPWDDVLKKFIPRMRNEENLRQYARDTEEMLSSIDDSHGWIRWPQTDELYGKYILPFTVKCIGKTWLITSILNDSLAATAGIRPGDIIDSLDGRAMQILAEELAPCTPASNPASRINKLSYTITRRHNPQSRLSITRQNIRSNPVVTNMIPNFFMPPNLTPAYFALAKDSAFCLLDDNIGYLNLGKIKRADSTRFTAMIARTKGLIIDTRQNQDETYGTGAGDIIGRLILPPDHNFMRFSSAQPTYPGVFRLTKPGDAGFPSITNYYRNKIAILINQNTMSVGEFIAMAYKVAPKAKLIGTPTTGADGSVTYLTLPGAAIIQFTALGVYHADGSETQRTGIQPDITVRQTLAGYQAKKDEQLDKALEWLKH